MWEFKFICANIAVLLAGLPLSSAYASQSDRAFFKAQAVVIMIGATDSHSHSGQAPIAVDFNLLTSVSGTVAPDLIGIDGYVMNSNSGWDAGVEYSDGATNLKLLNQTHGGSFSNGDNSNFLETTDSFSSFGLDGTTDINTRDHLRLSRFLIVSNTAFDVYAQASNLITSGDFTSLDYENIGINLRLHRTGGTGVGAWGAKAQNPSVGGNGLVSSIRDLDDLSVAPTKVFDGGRRTASVRGTLLEQAVSFSARYALSPDPDSGHIDAYDMSMGAGSIGADITFTIYTP